MTDEEIDQLHEKINIAIGTDWRVAHKSLHSADWTYRWNVANHVLIGAYGAFIALSPTTYWSEIDAYFQMLTRIIRIHIAEGNEALPDEATYNQAQRQTSFDFGSSS